jgi:putative salt-induced outer membrane protein
VIHFKENFMKIRGALVAIGLLVFTAPLLAAGDTIVLRNGDQMTGTFVNADGKTMALKTPYVGQISVKWSDVTQITTTESVYVTISSKKIVNGTISKTADAIVVHTTTGDVDVPLSQVAAVRSPAEEKKYEASLHPSLTRNWEGNVGLGFSLARGNSQSTALTTSVNLKRKTLSDKISMYENSVDTTATAANTVTANAILGGARYDRNLDTRLFGFVSGDYTHDGLQGLDLRQIYSGGLGWHAISTLATTLDLGAGGNFTRETYSGTATLSPGLSLQRNLAAITTSENLTHKFGKITSIDENFYFYPELSNTGQYRFTLNAAANTNLTGLLSWQVSVNDLYVSNPPIVGTKSNDLILATSLVVTFHH